MRDQEFLENKKRDNIDLMFYYCGMEKCESGHSYGPAVRDHFLIHYILEGEGTFYVNDKVYKLHKNQGFLICPDKVTYYKADKKSPWIYMWVGFNGIKAETYLKHANLSHENPIFTYDCGNLLEQYISQMFNLSELTYANDVKILGLLYLFLSELIGTSKPSPSEEDDDITLSYIKKCLDYIEKNYSTSLSISNLAKYIGLNRSYLSTIFKNTLNVSPKEFLINYRINKACELMKNSNLSISDISRSVGYNDPLTFSKVFKNVKTCSPTQYREEMSK